jgi:hypothetical protein
MNLLEYAENGKIPDSPDELQQLFELLTPDEKTQFLMDFFIQREDLKQLKQAILTTLQRIGIMDESGRIKDKIDWKKMFSLIKSFMWDTEEAAKKFEYLKELSPLIEKYKNL